MVSVTFIRWTEAVIISLMPTGYLYSCFVIGALIGDYWAVAIFIGVFRHLLSTDYLPAHVCVVCGRVAFYHCLVVYVLSYITYLYS